MSILIRFCLRKESKVMAKEFSIGLEYAENLTTWKRVLDCLRPLGEQMYRIHKQRKFYGRIFGNLENNS